MCTFLSLFFLIGKEKIEKLHQNKREKAPKNRKYDKRGNVIKKLRIQQSIKVKIRP